MAGNLGIAFVKHNRSRTTADGREQAVKMLGNFLGSIEGSVPGLRGYAILENRSDPQELLVLTFWKSPEEMDEFYSPANRRLQGFLEASGHLLEQLPTRTDYRADEFVL